MSIVEADAINSVGARAYMNADFSLAEDCFLKALQLDPQHAEARSNLGLVYQNCGLPGEAAQLYMEALRLKPDYVEAIINVGWLSQEQGHLDNAIRSFRRALELKPEHHHARANLAIALLMDFQFDEGWKLYDQSRFDSVPGTPSISKRRTYDAHMPLWDGSPCRKLAIWQEQGLGDTILYSTLLSELVARGQKFVMEIDPRLVSIYQRSIPEGEFCTKEQATTTTWDIGTVNITPSSASAFADCDAHIPVGSLPRFFRSAAVDFLRQPEALVRSDRKNSRVFWPDDDRKRIALSWRSFQPALRRFIEDKKSCPLANFAPLGARDDLRLIDVQYGNTAAERGECAWLTHFDDLDATFDLERLFAVIDACDAVVTISNVTAHFAGALGKPCYLLLRSGGVPYHYWSSADGACLWYPSVSIIAAPTWERAVAEVMERL